MPLEPAWDRYFDMALVRQLHCLTVRDNGVLVGYLFVVVCPHLHYASTLWAQTDLFWLDPAYRSGFTGVRMFKEMEKKLREFKVKVVYINAKLHFESDRGTIGKIFERLGYKAVEIAYSKYLGD